MSTNEQMNDAIGWMAECGMFMVLKGFDEYPIASDAALFVNSKQVSYEYIVEAIKELVGNNTNDSDGYPLVPLDVGTDATYMIAVDFVSRPNGFRLINRSKCPKVSQRDRQTLV